MAVVSFPCFQPEGWQSVPLGVQGRDVMGEGPSRTWFGTGWCKSRPLLPWPLKRHSPMNSELSYHLVSHLFLSGFEESRGRGGIRNSAHLPVWNLEWIGLYINGGGGSKWTIKRTGVSLISQLPVESAWAIITMVTKDLGRQSLFIPVHSFTPLFSHIKKSWKNIKLPAPQCCAFCLWTAASSSSPFCFHAYPPASTPTHCQEGVLLPTCCVMSSAEHRSLWGTPEWELESTLSDVHTSSYERWVDSWFLFSSHCLRMLKWLVVLVVCFMLMPETDEAALNFLFVQVFDTC